MTHCAYMLSSEMRDADEVFERRREFSDCSSQLANGSVLADQLPSYVGMIVDDVALLAALAIGVSDKFDVDGMGSLKSARHAKAQELSPIRPLLDKLDNEDSWWHKGFRRAHGMRQLLIHHQHLVEFQGGHSGDGPLTIQAFLHEPIGQSSGAVRIEYFAEMREILDGLALWCDEVEDALAGLVNVPAKFHDHDTATFLPTHYSLGTFVYERKYQVLPLCGGSDPLPWKINVDPTDGGFLLRNE